MSGWWNASAVFGKLPASFFGSVRRLCRCWRWLLGLGVLLAGGFAAILLLPMDTGRYLEVKPSAEMQDREGRLLYPFLNEDEAWCFVRPLDRISPQLVHATLAAEDRRFYVHPGVDPLAMLRALGQNLRKGRVFSGASTLAMQVVKMTDGHRPSLWGKAVQAIQALRLQLRVSREEILWAYLNQAPYGLNLVGCEAAARRYFGKSARELTLDEAAALAGLPKAPSLYQPLKYPQRTLRRRAYVLQRMQAEGYISATERQWAQRQRLHAEWHEFPKLAPHLAMSISDRLRQAKPVRTTLDAAVQQRIERIIRLEMTRHQGEIDNAAALVVDVSTAQVLARVGSADFWNAEADGQVDVCLAERSPGSALKPFNYALAMEDDRLYACETLYDGSWDQGLYRPENFDLNYQGIITAARALMASRNVPAVTVLERNGVEHFHRFLKDCGLTTLRRQAEHYGLGLILGNCEVKLEELAGAYLMLASLGEYRPLRYFLHRPAPAPQRRLSRGVCLKIYEMLEQPFPNDLHRESIHQISTRTRVCWKTGTSPGYRDAWTFAFNRQYLVAVWMGNTDGRSSAGLVGARAALPLAAKIFRALPQRNDPAWVSIAGDLAEVKVCALSGLPVSRWCPHSRTEYLPATQLLHRICDVHYPAPPEAPEAGVIERFPASALGWDLAEIRIPWVRPGAAEPEFAARKKELRILSPAPQAQYVLTGEPNGDRLQLKSSAETAGPVHWYLNRQYLGTSTQGESLYLDLTAGTQQLSCMTESGETESIRFEVLTPEAILQN